MCFPTAVTAALGLLAWVLLLLPPPLLCTLTVAAAAASSMLCGIIRLWLLLPLLLM
jgi:hypothetical protein